MGLYLAHQALPAQSLANTIIDMNLSGTGILTATSEYVSLSSGGAYVYSPGVALAGSCLMRSRYTGNVVSCVFKQAPSIVTTTCNSTSIVVGTAKTIVSLIVSLPGGGGQSELYFRVVAGRPCQIALGTTNKKRIQSVSPKLPAALGVSSDGYYITGTPVITGVHTFTVTADDGSQLQLAIEVLPASFIVR